MNHFLGSDIDFDSIALHAKEFDNVIREEFARLSLDLAAKTPDHKRPVVSQALRQDLNVIFQGDDGHFIENLADRIADYLYAPQHLQAAAKANIIPLLGQAVLSVQNTEGRVYRLTLKQNGNNLLRSRKATLDANKLKECLLDSSQIKCIDEEEALDQASIEKLILAIKATKNINDIVLVAQIETKSIAYSQLAAIESIFAKDPDVIFKRSFFHKKLLEMRYGAMNPGEFKDIPYYKKIYDFLKEKFKYRINSDEACLFVTNELFFGKDTVWPSTFQSVIPTSHSNVISCINFLMDGIDSQEDRVVFPNLQDADQLFHSETHKDLPYRSHHNILELPIFRNTSRFFHSGTLLSEYIKSSYFMESETALDFGYAYLFGARKNKKISESTFTDMVLQKISNQICRDLVCGVRTEQDDPKIPIHIVQSNTLDIHPYVFDSKKLSYFPGKPNVIIHADPLWSEVLIASHDDRINFSQDTMIPIVHADTMKYKNARPVYEFKFNLPKDGYIDHYTITHWILNTESQKYRSFPTE